MANTVTKPNAYWHRRQEHIYYQVVRVIASKLGENAGSIIDVGSAGCPYLDWFQNIPVRTSLDLKRPYVAPGINPLKADFLTWEPDRRYDLATCLQVLEHVPDATAFAQKLLATANIVVVSLPYKWPVGYVKSHVHDPVDEAKLLSWFGRKPNYTYICREFETEVERIIQVYDCIPDKWNSLRERTRIFNRIAHGKAAAQKKRPAIQTVAVKILSLFDPKSSRKKGLIANVEKLKSKFRTYFS
jgi:hypothetical protein